MRPYGAHNGVSAAGCSAVCIEQICCDVDREYFLHVFYDGAAILCANALMQLPASWLVAHATKSTAHAHWFGRFGKPRLAASSRIFAFMPCVEYRVLASTRTLLLRHTYRRAVAVCLLERLRHCV